MRVLSLLQDWPLLTLQQPLLLVQVNSEPFEGGWMMKVKLSNKGDLDSLMDSKAYEAHCEAGGH